MKNHLISIIMLCLVVLLTGCGDEPGRSVDEPEVLLNESIERPQEESPIKGRPQTIEEWATQVGAQWSGETQWLAIRIRDPEGQVSVERFEFGSLLLLPDSELQRIREFTINGSEIIDPETIDFSRFTSLEELSVGYTNLNSIKGINHSPIQGLGLGNVPIKDISLIAQLSQVRGIGIGSTEIFEVPDDLSGLVALETLSLEAPGLKSMEGIKTIPNPFTMSVVGVVKDGRYQYPDVEAFRSLIGSKARVLYMSFETEQRYGPELQQIVEEVRQYNPNFFISGFGP